MRANPLMIYPPSNNKVSRLQLCILCSEQRGARDDITKIEMGMAVEKVAEKGGHGNDRDDDYADTDQRVDSEDNEVERMDEDE